MDIKFAIGIATLILGASATSAQAGKSNDSIKPESEPLTTIVGKKAIPSDAIGHRGTMCPDGRIVFSKPRCN